MAKTTHRVGFAKLNARISGGPAPRDLFDIRKNCPTAMLQGWSALMESGKFASTRDLQKKLLTGEVFKCDPKNENAAWVNSIAGETPTDQAHGAFLEALMRAEERPMIFDQKLSQLSALQILITRSDGQYPQAVQDVAAFFRDDVDERIVDRATEFIRALPLNLKIRGALDFVRPDLMVAPVKGTVSALRSFGRLSSLIGARTTAMIGTVAVHGAAPKGAVSVTGKKSSELASVRATVNAFKKFRTNS